MDRLDRRLSRFLAPGGDGPLHPRGGQAVHDLGAAADPVLHPQRARTGTSPGARPQAIQAAVARRPARGDRRRCRRPGSAARWPAAVAASDRGLLGRPTAGAAARRRGRRPVLDAGERRVRGDAPRRRRDRPAGSRGATTTSAAAPTTSSTRPAGRSSSWTPRRRADPRRGRSSATSRGGPAEASRIGERDDRWLIVDGTRDGLRASVEIALPAADDPAELWTITLENLTDVGAADQGRARTSSGCSTGPTPTAATRSTTGCSPRSSTSSGLHAVLAWDKHSKAMGVLAVGRRAGGVPVVAGRLHRPRPEPRVAAGPGDPGLHRGPRHRRPPDLRPDRQPPARRDRPAAGIVAVRLLIGLVADKRQAIDLVARHLRIPLAEAVPADRRRKASHPIGHGEIPPGTPSAVLPSSPTTAGGCSSARRSRPGRSTTRCRTRSGMSSS